MKTSVALIGFMGTGKTAVGRRLAERLGKDFVETDAIIEQRAGKPIADIFREDGELAFRELEIAAIKEIAGRRNQVVAGGGGVVLNWLNIQRLQGDAVVVLLTATPAVILRRAAAGGAARPLLNVPDRAATVRNLLKFRRPFYTRAAEITVDTSRLSLEEVVTGIINRLKEYEGFSF